MLLHFLEIFPDVVHVFVVGKKRRLLGRLKAMFFFMHVSLGSGGRREKMLFYKGNSETWKAKKMIILLWP